MPPTNRGLSRKPVWFTRRQDATPCTAGRAPRWTPRSTRPAGRKTFTDGQGNEETRTSAAVGCLLFDFTGDNVNTETLVMTATASDTTPQAMGPFYRARGGTAPITYTEKTGTAHTAATTMATPSETRSRPSISRSIPQTGRSRSIDANGGLAMNTTDHQARFLVCLAALLLTMSTPTQAETRLLTEAIFGNVAEVRRLLDAGADPNQRDAQGYTPLNRAVIGYATGMGDHGNHLDVARVLLAAGADPNQRDRKGYTVNEFTRFLAEEFDAHDHLGPMIALLEGRSNVGSSRPSSTEYWGAILVLESKDGEMTQSVTWDYSSARRAFEKARENCNTRRGYCDVENEYRVIQVVFSTSARETWRSKWGNPALAAGHTAYPRHQILTIRERCVAFYDEKQAPPTVAFAGSEAEARDLWESKFSRSAYYIYPNGPDPLRTYCNSR